MLSVSDSASFELNKRCSQKYSIFGSKFWSFWFKRSEVTKIPKSNVWSVKITDYDIYGNGIGAKQSYFQYRPM